jgi:hypothetical protein
MTIAAANAPAKATRITGFLTIAIFKVAHRLHWRVVVDHLLCDHAHLGASVPRHCAEHFQGAHSVNLEAVHDDARGMLDQLLGT